MSIYRIADFIVLEAMRLLLNADCEFSSADVTMPDGTYARVEDSKLPQHFAHCALHWPSAWPSQGNDLEGTDSDYFSRRTHEMLVRNVPCYWEHEMESQIERRLLVHAYQLANDYIAMSARMHV